MCKGIYVFAHLFAWHIISYRKECENPDGLALPGAFPEARHDEVDLFDVIGQSETRGEGQETNENVSRCRHL